MILVDSSAFIEYYRPKGVPAIQNAVGEAVKADLVWVNGVIQVEVLGFASGRPSFRELRHDFDSFHWIEVERADFDLATEIGLSLRKRGITVPAPDLIIAASAIRVDAVLYHADSHYDSLARHSDLKATNLRRL
jgi:predicted nucleic acid-binding protein